MRRIPRQVVEKRHFSAPSRDPQRAAFGAMGDPHGPPPDPSPVGFGPQDEGLWTAGRSRLGMGVLIGLYLPSRARLSCLP